jgi:demethylmenaquinone methyltransferase/2-methoxy-6-polyprenyl-1,4-benzoquinol methylase
MSQAVQTMFDRISGRYDFLNRFLSLRHDVAWRRKACRMAGPAESVLDLCGGTGDFLLTFHKIWGDAGYGVIGDFSQGMLRMAQLKAPNLAVVQLDALALPLPDHCVDLVLCGFGMRNLDNLDTGLLEVSRVLKDSGRLVVLEFFRPTNMWTKFFYNVLGPVFIPIAGALFSGRREAYEYLVRSVKRFVTADQFVQRGGANGLTPAACVPLDGGIAHLVVFTKDLSHGK